MLIIKTGVKIISDDRTYIKDTLTLLCHTQVTVPQCHALFAIVRCWSAHGSQVFLSNAQAIYHGLASFVITEIESL